MRNVFIMPVIALWFAVTSVGAAQPYEETYVFDIPSLNVKEALNRLAKQTHHQLLFSYAMVEALESRPVKGEYTITEAMDMLLKGTGLSGTLTKRGVILVKAKKPHQRNDNDRGKDVNIKNNKLTLFAGIAAFFSSVAVTPTVAAQDTGGKTEAGVVEEVIVTATRREEALQDVPLSVAALDPNVFETLGQVSVRDLVAYVPGFEAENRLGGPPGLGSLLARGALQTPGTSPTVGIYVDDTPMSSNGFTASFIYFDASLLDLERVEFLKGPQGTLFGANSVGGAVRYITRQPALTEVRGSLSSNFSTTKEGGFNKIHSARVSVPVIEDRLGLTLSGFFEDNAGVADAVDINGNMVQKNTDRYERYGVGLDIFFQMTDRLDARLKYTRQDLDFSEAWAGSVDTDLNLQPMFGPFDSIADPNARTEIIGDFYSATLSYDFDWATLSSSTAYTEANYHSARQILPGGFTALVDSLTGRPAGTTQFIDSIFDLPSERFTQEFKLVSTGEGKFEWMAGFYYTDEDSIQFSTFIAEPGNLDIFTIDVPRTYKEYAAFGNVTYHFTDSLDATVGVRLSKQKEDFFSTSSGTFTVPGVTRDTTKNTVDTYMFNLRYRPSEDMSLYARIASGFRPGFAQVPILENGVAFADEVEPDDIWSYELGTKGNLAEGRVSYDIALFYSTWDKFQTEARTPSGANTFFDNVEDSVTIKGFEGSFEFKPVDNFSIVSSLSYTKSTLDSDEPAISGVEGFQLPRVPKWTASSVARYDFNVFAGLDAHVGGGFRYTSGRNVRFDNGNVASPNLPSDGYVLADLSAGITNGRVSFDLYVTNLLDNYAFTVAETFPADAQINVVRPRTVGAVITLDF